MYDSTKELSGRSTPTRGFGHLAGPKKLSAVQVFLDVSKTQKR
jgi:hypothetical protein